MTRTLDLGMRVILRDPQEFLAEIGVVLQDPNIPLGFSSHTGDHLPEFVVPFVLEH